MGHPDSLQGLEKSLDKEAQKRKFGGKPPLYLSYATHDDLLAAVTRGEVDYAIGGLTRAKYREESGIFFTRGYAYALPMFVSKSSRARPPQDGDRIGVLPGSINERALTYLGESKRFVVVNETSIPALEDDLRNESVDFIFVERLASTWGNEFKNFGTLYSELESFYHERLGYSAVHSIATAARDACKKLDVLIEELEPPLNIHSYDEFMRRLYALYVAEGKSVFNVSVYRRLMDEYFAGDETTCGK